jgi:GxxExxY protein
MEQDPTTAAIIGAAMEVSNTLGAGFLEKVYRRALSAELRMRGERVEEEVRYAVGYKGRCVGEYVADMVVGGRVVVELKCAQCIGNEHVAQAMNYLRASGLEVGLVLNFQRARVEWKRVVMTQGPREENLAADERG